MITSRGNCEVALTISTSADEERVFLISEELEFRTGETDGEATLIWRDLEGDVDEFYEFVATGTNAPTLAFFETCMYRAMYERKYRKSADSINDSDLQEFAWVYVWQISTPTLSLAYHKFRPPEQRALAKSTASKGKATQKTPSKGAAASASAATKQLVASSEPDQLAGAYMVEIVAVEAELYQWNLDTEEFVVVDDSVTAKIMKRGSSGFDYWLVASKGDKNVHTHQVCQDMNPRWVPARKTITWNDGDEQNVFSSWLFLFPDDQSFEAFKNNFAIAGWETVNQMPWGKVKVRTTWLHLQSQLLTVIQPVR